MGIDEKEIGEVPIGSAASGQSAKYEANGSAPNLPGSMKRSETGNATSSIVKREEPAAIEKITRQDLGKMKGFQKLLKKQSKEIDEQRKKHNKEKALMQKQHSAAVDKMTSAHGKKATSQLSWPNSYNVTSM
jgi:hypothetical protein